MRISDWSSDLCSSDLQRTGPILRCEALSVQSDLPIEIEMPHLHHDAQALQAGQTVRLRTRQFSLFARGTHTPVAHDEAPTLIGRARARGRMCCGWRLAASRVAGGDDRASNVISTGAERDIGESEDN